MAATKTSYAIISLGGKQYRVREGERLLVDRLKTDEGKTFNPVVLFLGGDGDGTLSPRTQVTAKVVGHVLGDKIRIGKYDARSPATGSRPASGRTCRRSRSSRSAAPRSRLRRQLRPPSRRRRRRRRNQSRRQLQHPPRHAAPAPRSPPRGYEDFTVAEIAEKSKRWKVEQLEAALKFEKKNANRKGAIAALESALAAKQEKN